MGFDEVIVYKLGFPKPWMKNLICLRENKKVDGTFRWNKVFLILTLLMKFDCEK